MQKVLTGAEALDLSMERDPNTGVKGIGAVAVVSELIYEVNLLYFSYFNIKYIKICDFYIFYY